MNMMAPKRTKYRKQHKGRIHGNAKGNFSLNFGNYGALSFLNYELETFRLDALSRIFGLIFLIASALGNLYALGDTVDKLQRSAALAYAGGAIAAVFAGDMITLFVFFEIAK